MAWITDSLTSAIQFASRLSPFQRVSTVASTALPNVFTHQLAVAAYMSSGMLRKVIRIPAADRTQKWRDWQADKDSIGKIEAEERRLGLRAKTKEVEVLRGIGGGALLLITEGDHDQPLTFETIRAGGLIAINVVSRWEIQCRDFDKNLASPTYRMPGMFEISDGQRQQNIHPSRVICFRGPPLPAGSSVGDEEAFWGDSRLLQVFREVENSDHAQAWFVELVKKAKLLRVGIPDLLDMVATSDGRAKLDQRIALIATGESTLNATVYRSGTGADDPGEKIDDYQVTWTGIPEFMDALDQRIAAVSDIPFTRLMGRSPAGMNATGKSDQDNYWSMVADGQENETRPCLEAIDPILLRSAGIAKPDDVTWRWAPLWTPTEAEEATTFKTTMEAVEKLQQTGAIPDRAFAEGVQNLMLEREYVPGLEAALAKIPESERYGLEESEPEEDDPSELRAANENEVEELRRRGAINEDQARALVNDARPRSLYVSRKLLNADEFIAWAEDQGFETTLAADELHVKVAYSRTAVDWLEMGESWDWSEPKDGKLVVSPGGPRMVEPLGDKGAVVLMFVSNSLIHRHEEMIRKGASHDFPEYQPHVTISYAGGDIDLSKVEPFRGKLVFGPEIFEEIDEDWTGKVTEDGGGPNAAVPFGDAKRRSKGQRLSRRGRSGYDPTQPRGRNGRWIPAGTRRYIDEAATRGGSGPQLIVGRLGGQAAPRIEGLGLRANGKAVAIDSSAVRHIMIRHGKERRSGHVSVRGGDVASAASIINRASTFRLTRPAGNGAPRVLTLTRWGNHRIYALWEVRRKAVTLSTMWIRK